MPIEISEFDKETMRSAVECTAKVLSEVLPEWQTLIDWESFDFSSGKDCIRGQLIKNHQEIIDRMYGTFGFDVPHSIKTTYPLIACAWPIELWHFMEAEWRKFKPV